MFPSLRAVARGPPRRPPISSTTPPLLRTWTRSIASRRPPTLPPRHPLQQTRSKHDLPDPDSHHPRRSALPPDITHTRGLYADPSGRKLIAARPLLSRGDFSRAARSRTTHLIILFSVGSAFLFYFSHLETVPVSGRTRFNVYSSPSSSATVRAAGDTQFKAVLYDLERQGVHPLPPHDRRVRRVRRVLERLIPFSGMADEAWEVYVIPSDGTMNAFVLPGGKVFVFSGILRLANTDSMLAAVLGHEIAHNVADHVGERMSAAIGTNIVLYSAMALVGFLGFGPLLMHFVGSRFLEVAFGNPMSRLQEKEADYIGLMMMAEACFDPREAVAFWTRMMAAAKEEVPEWVSTHPSNAARVEAIREWLPEAWEKRENSDCRTTSSFAEGFRRAMGRGVIIVG